VAQGSEAVPGTLPLPLQALKVISQSVHPRLSQQPVRGDSAHHTDEGSPERPLSSTYRGSFGSMDRAHLLAFSTEINILLSWPRTGA
jgi:hypothetical protein